MKVAILDDYFDTLRTLDSFALLDGHDVTVFTDHVEDVDELAARLAGVEALILIRERTAVGADLLDRLPSLRLISQRSVYPHVDVAACTARGVLLCSDLHADTACLAAAELTWALILASRRDLVGQVASMRAGRWQSGVGRSLNGQVLGLYGFGRIARVVAGYARAFSMPVQVWSSGATRSVAAAEGVAVAASREAFFATSDVVSLHQRLVPATRGAVGPADLALMKPDSLLVNTSRAGLIAPGALVAALRSGRPGFAALDVFGEEPLTDVDDPLLAMSNVLCTPHVGYVTREEWELQFRDVFAQVNDFVEGHPTHVVNPEVLETTTR